MFQILHLAAFPEAIEQKLRRSIYRLVSHSAQLLTTLFNRFFNIRSLFQDRRRSLIVSMSTTAAGNRVWQTHHLFGLRIARDDKSGMSSLALSGATKLSTRKSRNLGMKSIGTHTQTQQILTRLEISRILYLPRRRLAISARHLGNLHLAKFPNHQVVQWVRDAAFDYRVNFGPRVEQQRK